MMKKTQDIMVTDYGEFVLSEETIYAYTGFKTLAEASVGGSGKSKRIQAVKDMEHDLRALSKYHWLRKKELRIA